MSTTDVHDRVLQLFEAAHRHLFKVDAELRTSIMEAARDTLMHPVNRRSKLTPDRRAMLGVTHK